MLQIPTDSIGKLFAVLGLAVMGTSTTLFFNELEKSRYLEGTLASIYAEAEVKTKMSNLIKDAYLTRKESIFKKIKNNQHISDGEIDDFKKSVKSLEDETGNYIAFTEKSYARIKEIKTLKKYTAYYFFAFGATFIIGLGSSIFGFRAWHKMSK
ncbi:hypothetical protein QU487_08375 [Crenobacter sp. SG2305]|uniref:hypothetical protein n=1 Tax=Crenobacter oryzisoli TaxID=3056844 RepID=UPI0025AA891C|nr:hypothetical protein [Crenobacter sp. SG2305]MDN0082766.1 hypothetical protein [Crenobacter sp. SG2305]